MIPESNANDAVYKLFPNTKTGFILHFRQESEVSVTDQNDFIDPDPIITERSDDGVNYTPIAEKPALDHSEEKTLAMFAHLGIFLNLLTAVLGILPPLIIYFAYKDRSKYVAYQSLQALIFQGIFFFGGAILAGITWAVSGVLSVVLIGLLCIPIAILLSLIPVAAMVYAIVAAVDSYHHRDFKYWLIGDWVRDTYEA